MYGIFYSEINYVMLCYVFLFLCYVRLCYSPAHILFSQITDPYPLTLLYISPWLPQTPERVTRMIK